MNTATLAQLVDLLTSALASPPTEARRLVHGRGRLLPGLEQLTVDWLEGVVRVGVFRELPADELAALRSTLMALADSPAWAASGAQSLLLQHRYRLDAASETLIGVPVGEHVIHEDGLKFGLDLSRRQNMGLFLDMRLGRRWVREQAADLRILNLFAYTCGFSVAALAGGAAQVVNLDMARGPLTRGRENHRLNGHDLGKVSFLGHELFKSWGKVRKLGPYDLVIVDPPSFQQGSFALTKDYARILRRLPELLTPGGRVLACVNDPGVGADFLIAGMAEEAPSLAFVERLANPPEFADEDPEGGLKVLVFQQGQAS